MDSPAPVSEDLTRFLFARSLVEKHLPGQHDQKSHGNRGVKPEVVFSTGDIPIDKRLRASAERAVAAIYQDFPGLLPPHIEFHYTGWGSEPGMIAWVDRDDTRAIVYMASMRMGNTWDLLNLATDNPDMMMAFKAARASGLSGDEFIDKVREAILYHELAHVAANYNFGGPSAEWDEKGIITHQYPRYNSNWYPHPVSGAYGAGSAGVDDSLPSAYASRDFREFFAEALSEAHYEGDTASPYAKLTAKLFRERVGFSGEIETMRRLGFPIEKDAAFPHGPSIKWPKVYQALRREGKSKSEAAAISNAHWNKYRRWGQAGDPGPRSEADYREQRGRKPRKSKGIPLPKSRQLAKGTPLDELARFIYARSLVNKHHGPGPHKSGSPQQAHAGGESIGDEVERLVRERGEARITGDNSLDAYRELRANGSVRVVTPDGVEGEIVLYSGGGYNASILIDHPTAPRAWENARGATGDAADAVAAFGSLADKYGLRRDDFAPRPPGPVVNEVPRIAGHQPLRTDAAIVGTTWNGVYRVLSEGNTAVLYTAEGVRAEISVQEDGSFRVGMRPPHHSWVDRHWNAGDVGNVNRAMGVTQALDAFSMLARDYGLENTQFIVAADPRLPPQEAITDIQGSPLPQNTHISGVDASYWASRQPNFAGFKATMYAMREVEGGRMAPVRITVESADGHSWMAWLGNQHAYMVRPGQLGLRSMRGSGNPAGAEGDALDAVKAMLHEEGINSNTVRPGLPWDRASERSMGHILEPPLTNASANAPRSPVPGEPSLPASNPFAEAPHQGTFDLGEAGTRVGPNSVFDRLKASVGNDLYRHDDGDVIPPDLRFTSGDLDFVIDPGSFSADTPGGYGRYDHYRRLSVAPPGHVVTPEDFRNSDLQNTGLGGPHDGRKYWSDYGMPSASPPVGGSMIFAVVGNDVFIRSHSVGQRNPDGTRTTDADTYAVRAGMLNVFMDEIVPPGGRLIYGDPSASGTSSVGGQPPDWMQTWANDRALIGTEHAVTFGKPDASLPDRAPRLGGVIITSTVHSQGTQPFSAIIRDDFPVSELREDESGTGFKDSVRDVGTAIFEAEVEIDGQVYKSVVSSASGDHEHFSIQGNILTADGTRVGDYARTLDYNDGSCYNSHLTIYESFQGKGVGTALLSHWENELSASGIHEMNLGTANIGRYAWAAAGYDWGEHNADYAAERLSGYLNGYGGGSGSSDGHSQDETDEIYGEAESLVSDFHDVEESLTGDSGYLSDPWDLEVDTDRYLVYNEPAGEFDSPDEVPLNTPVWTTMEINQNYGEAWQVESIDKLDYSDAVADANGLHASDNGIMANLVESGTYGELLGGYTGGMGPARARVPYNTLYTNEEMELTDQGTLDDWESDISDVRRAWESFESDHGSYPNSVIEAIDNGDWEVNDYDEDEGDPPDASEWNNWAEIKEEIRHLVDQHNNGYTLIANDVANIGVRYRSKDHAGRSRHFGKAFLLSGDAWEGHKDI